MSFSPEDIARVPRATQAVSSGPQTLIREIVDVLDDPRFDVPVQVYSAGYGLHYARDGSSPVGRIRVETGTGSGIILRPGEGFRGYFERFSVQRASHLQWERQWFRIVVEATPDARFVESFTDPTFPPARFVSRTPTWRPAIFGSMEFGGAALDTVENMIFPGGFRKIWVEIAPCVAGGLVGAGTLGTVVLRPLRWRGANAASIEAGAPGAIEPRALVQDDLTLIPGDNLRCAFILDVSAFREVQGSYPPPAAAAFPWGRDGDRQSRPALGFQAISNSGTATHCYVERAWGIE